MRLPTAGLVLCLAGTAMLAPAAAAPVQPLPDGRGSGSTSQTGSQSSIPPEQRAADDAFQNLVDKILALRLEDDHTTVAELLILRAASHGTAPDTAGLHERKFRRELLDECQRGGPRPTVGGGVEVDVWLPTARLNEMLKSAGARVVLHARAGPTITATGRCLPDGRPRDDRPGWRQCTPEQIVQTRTAVQLDVRRRLLDRVAAMRVAGADPLRVVLARFPLFREAVVRRVYAVPLDEPVFEPDGVCRLTLLLPRDALRTWVQAAAAESKEDLPREAAQAVDPEETDRIEGLAVPPPYFPPPSRTQPVAEPGRPAWADRVLSARAAGAPPADVQDAQARRDLALKAARLEAARLLWLDIEKLPLASGTVGQALARSPRMRETAAAIDALIVPVSDPAFDSQDRATVTLGVRLEPLWRTIRDLR